MPALADELLRRDFGSREWFQAACRVAHIQPRVLLESSASHTLILLAATEYGLAIVRMRKCPAARYVRHGGKVLLARQLTPG